jgi:ABC-type uncharacterized transport system involved in gliding motility auxiliary subunit
VSDALARRRRERLFSNAGAALVLGILAALNALGAYVFARLDLSAGRVYSISSGTKDVLKGLKDNLVIKAYFTRRLPPPYGLNEQYLRDLLSEYKAAGGRRIKVEFLDPAGDERVKQEARAAGIMPVKLSVTARDKFELKEAYLGLALLYRGKTEILPLLQDREQFEYEITRRVKKLSGASLKTAGFVVGHGEKSPSTPGYDAVFDAARDNFELEEVLLSKPIPAKIDALWLLGPQTRIPQNELERLKSWVAEGGALGIMLDRKTVDFQNFASRRVETGVELLLEQWGLEDKDGFVADLQSERIELQNQQGPFTITNVVEYPLIPVATRFNEGHPATRALDAVIFPFPHPLVFKGPAKGGLLYQSLVDSTPHSWYETTGKLSPLELEPKSEAGERGPFSLTGVIQGNFGEVTPSTVAATERGARPAAVGTVLVIGTSRILSPQFALRGPNLGAFLNFVEWSLHDEALLSIRSKGLGFRPLKPLRDAARAVIKNVLIFLPPLALVLVGLGSFARRRRRLSALPAAYADA